MFEYFLVICKLVQIFKQIRTNFFSNVSNMDTFNKKKLNNGKNEKNIFQFNFKEVTESSKKNNNHKNNMFGFKNNSKKVKVSSHNKSSFSWFSLAIVLVLLFIIGVGTFVFISKLISDDVNNQIKKEYTISTPVDYPAKNMNDCPTGCLRGICSPEKAKKDNNKDSKTNQKPHCEYDFQCNYCKDPSTNQFYVNFEQNQKRKIVPVYEEEMLGTIAEKKLNEEIKKNNQYIKKLNAHIKEINEEEYKYS